MVQDQQHQPLITYTRFVVLNQRTTNHYLRMKENIPYHHSTMFIPVKARQTRFTTVHSISLY